MRIINRQSLSMAPAVRGVRHLNPPFAEAIRKTPRIRLADRTGFPEEVLEALANDRSVAVAMSWTMWLHIKHLASVVGFDGELFHEPGCPCGKEVA